MSLDYPYYEELCRRKHRAAWWWIVGDRLYYLGGLMALLGVGSVIVGAVAGTFGYRWRWAKLGAVAVPLGALVFQVGAQCKGRAYTLGERDGISAAEVYERNDRPPAADA